MNITPKQEKKYLDGQGTHCPYCDNEDIVMAGEIEPGTGCAWGTVKCRSCGESFTDCYTLTGVEGIQD